MSKSSSSQIKRRNQTQRPKRQACWANFRVAKDLQFLKSRSFGGGKFETLLKIILQHFLELCVCQWFSDFFFFSWRWKEEKPLNILSETLGQSLLRTNKWVLYWLCAGWFSQCLFFSCDGHFFFFKLSVTNEGESTKRYSDLPNQCRTPVKFDHLNWVLLVVSNY